MLKDSIPLGERYEINPDKTAKLLFVCGGCKRQYHLLGVWVYSRGQARAGFLPESIFSHVTPGVMPDELARAAWVKQHEEPRPG